MIVLENVGVARARKIDQGRPPRKTHRHAERELMGRSYVNYFWRALFRRPRDCDSLPVNRSGYDNRPCKAERSASLVKSRVFDPSNLPSIYERHRANHHCLLRSGRDDDLVWMTAGTSVITQVSRECLAQVGVA